MRKTNALKQPTTNPGRCRRIIKSILTTGLITAGLFNDYYVNAQWTGERMYNFNAHNFKNYAVAAFNGQDEYIMAGTVFSYDGLPDHNGVHLVKIDNTGNMVFSKVLSYTDPGPHYFWNNLQAVGVHIDNNNNIILIASAKNSYSHGYARFNGTRDEFIVFRFDANGNLDPAFTREMTAEIVGGDGVGYWNTYPTKTHLNGDNLYVCGYVSDDYKPDLKSDKRGFVIRIKLLAVTAAPMAAISFDAPNIYDNDLDMAKGLKIVSSGLWVGGSINGGPALNAILDPMTLNPIYTSSFGEPYGTVSHPVVVQNEESFDITEDPGGSGYYVFSNNARVAAIAAAPTNRYDLPGTFSVTAVKQDLTPYTSVKNRVKFNIVNDVWGVNLVPENITRPDHSVVLSGMQLESNCSQPVTTNAPITLYDNHDNIRPFLFSMGLKMNATGLNVTNNYFNVMESVVGTAPPTQPYSYYLLGGQENLINTPVTTVRDLSSTTDIFLSAPAYWYKYNKLGFKWIRTDQNAEVSGCEWQPQCTWSMASSTVPGGLIPVFGQADGSYSFQLPDFQVDDLNPDFIYGCNELYKGAPQGVDNINDPFVINTVMAPNPASDHIGISLKGDFDKNKELRIQLSDLTGKIVRILYTGKVAGLPADFSLSGVLPGVYMLGTQYDGVRLKIERLVIK